VNAGMIGILERGNCGFRCEREKKTCTLQNRSDHLLIHGEAIVTGF